MKRGAKHFFRRKQYTIAAAAVLVAALGITGVYYLGDSTDSKEPKQQVAENKEEKAQNMVTAEKEETEEDSEQTAKVSAVIEPKSNTDITEIQTEAEDTENEATEVKEQETVKTAAVVEPTNAAELHFDTAAGLVWPVDGAVIMDYSMDQTVYFTTLDQYKYNPAVVIAGNVNEKVKAAASGTITDVSTNEVTGCTVTMDLGDGYTAIYGQLKEVPYAAGTYVEAGNTLGFISEPTKYYSLEGSNVYFELQKDGESIDPVEYFQ
ncbi:MAG: M23 family metallopeptidase [Lachnospiraceae bacterium]|nr:M23 family metallopeptidase [Lachnospiraceae bacterium]